MRLSDWHKCRRYWRGGYRCPLREVPEHEDDDDEEKRERFPLQYRKRSERSLDNPIYPWIVADRLVERARRVQRIFGDPGPGQPVRPEWVPDEAEPDIPRHPKEVPAKPWEVPPIAAIAPGFEPVKLPYRQPVRSEVWDKEYMRQVQGAASTVEGKVRLPSTESSSARVSGRSRDKSLEKLRQGFGVMGTAESLFGRSLPRLRESRSDISERPRSVGRDWQRIGAGAALIGTGLTAAAIVHIRSKGPPAGGGKHMAAPKFRGGGKMPAFGFAP